MAESESHRRAKNAAAGANGQTEVPLSGGRRLDALSANGKHATEIERSGDPTLLKKAARRLADSGAPQRVLKVPQQDMPAAAEAMRAARVSGTLSNLGGTKTQRVRPKTK